MLFLGGKIKMNKKITGIFVCMLLIAIVIPVSGMINEDNKYTEQSNLRLAIKIEQPVDEYVYLFGKQAFEIPYMPFAIILGKIAFRVNISNIIIPIVCVNWYVDGNLTQKYTSEPYDWNMTMVSGFSGLHTVRAEVVNFLGGTADDYVIVVKFL
jgi:hypothetical protein